MCFTPVQNVKLIKLFAAFSGVKSFSRNSIMIKIKPKKTVSGRKKLDKNDKRKPVSIYLNQHEIDQIKSRIADLASYSFSQFIRFIVLEESKRPRHINPIQFLKGISKLTIEVNKLGTNVNQISKYTNQLHNRNLTDPKVAKMYNEIVMSYIELQKEIMEKLKGVLR